jgi:putative SOS response-associated peptidase YedK
MHVASRTAPTLELIKARWGMPSPPTYIKSRDPGVANIRNVNSPHWRRWLKPEGRCLVPFTSDSEFNRVTGSHGGDIWFALDKDRPLAFFAGIWTPHWTSMRKVKIGEETADLYGFCIFLVPVCAKELLPFRNVPMAIS